MLDPDFAPLLFSLGALALLPLFIVLDVARGKRLRAAEKRVLERTGLQASVEWLEPERLSGVRDGIPMSIAVGVSRPYPGKSETEGPPGTLVEAPAAGGDVLVCRRDLSDLIVGPLPAVPRHRTGDAAFDGGFDLFSADATFDASSFPPARARAVLQQLGLQYLRRKDGRLEVFLASISPNQAESVVALAVTLARPDEESRQPVLDPRYRQAGLGPSSPPIVVPPGDRERFATRHVSWPLVIAACFAALFATLGGALLPLVPAVHEALADIACDTPGATVVATTSQVEGGTSHGVLCMREGASPELTSNALNYACAGIAASVPLAVGLLLTLLSLVRLLRWPVPRA